MSLKTYAQRRGLTKKAVLKLFRAGHLPACVGKVPADLAPYSVSTWAKRNGIGLRAAYALYRAGLLAPLGVALNPNNTNALYYNRREGMDSTLIELRRLHRQREQLRRDLKTLLRAFSKANKHLAAVERTKRQVSRFRRRLDRFGRLHANMVVKHSHLRVAIERSQVLMSESEIAKVRLKLGLNPGLSLVRLRWDKEKKRRANASAKATGPIGTDLASGTPAEEPMPAPTMPAAASVAAAAPDVTLTLVEKATMLVGPNGHGHPKVDDVK